MEMEMEKQALCLEPLASRVEFGWNKLIQGLSCYENVTRFQEIFEYALLKFKATFTSYSPWMYAVDMQVRLEGVVHVLPRLPRRLLRPFQLQFQRFHVYQPPCPIITLLLFQQNFFITFYRIQFGTHLTGLEHLLLSQQEESQNYGPTILITQLLQHPVIFAMWLNPFVDI